MDVRKTITLPEQLMKRLDDLAASSDAPVDHIVAEAVAHFLNEVDKTEEVFRASRAAEATPG